MENISIALACTLLGAILSFLTFQRNKGREGRMKIIKISLNKKRTLYKLIKRKW